MKNQTAIMCHNIAKYNREHQEPEMTPLEATEKLETEATRREQLYQAAGFTDDDYGLISTLRYAASYLRKIASGEYAPVVHARWIPKYHLYGGKDLIADEFHCGICNVYSSSETSYCHNCGALMDGKDDSNEIN